ncbi:methylated-DNA--[protein]-cysteine S-methyltransferase [Clostridium sp. YIM B02515]|uniref:Methylated-DNA--protein-cysteine methyltransferase n=1 Tax=Clostridium rhizosphaerae TaxID=2803861 RepID=A0ABS1T5Q4_9CLOT|nr:methylated-DNA--[protein]-cysteine S-methyltransferase [Clostridium rhizosphaerae]MBL4934668.1 methylated-DNA--[protein]-cysteine S-methyltransferase [Clostridium rhizosphaerae]
MKSLFFYQTDIGEIGIAENGQAITNIYFQGESVPKDMVLNETNLIKEAAKQLNSYFAGELRTFELPLALEGTEFMRSVWKALCEIPYGKTFSYKDVAQSIGNPKAVRAVGNANNRNPIPIIIPCHRVIGSNGKLVGYGGGLEIKKYLLELEKGLS